MKPQKGAATTDDVSIKTFRVLRRKLGPGNQIELFSDFRTVEGVVLPFVRTGIVPGLGEVVATVTEAKFDGRIPDSIFHPEQAAGNSCSWSINAQAPYRSINTQAPGPAYPLGAVVLRTKNTPARPVKNECHHAL